MLLGLLALFALHRIVVQALWGHDLYMDEAQYWSWAQALDWGYYSKPPGVAAVIAASGTICGDSELCIRAGSLLLHPLTAMVVYALGCRLFAPHTAFWGALTYFLMPSIALSSQIITTDVPLLLCWATGMYAFSAALADNRWRHWLLLGAAFGLGLQCKYTMVAFLPSLGIVLLSSAALYRQFRNPRLYLALALGIAILAPNIVWNAAHDFPTFRHTASISQLGEGGPGLRPDHLLEFLGEQFLMAGPVIFATLLVGLWLLRRRWHNAGTRFLASFTLPLLLVICVQALLAKANGNWAAPAYVAGALWAAHLLLQWRRRVLVGALVINVLIGGIVLHYDQLMDALDVPLKRSNDPYWAMRGWREAGQTLGDIWRREPGTRVLFDQRDVMAQMLYYMQPRPLDAVMWNADEHVDNHYELTTRIPAGNGKWLLVTRREALPEELRSRFANERSVADFSIRPVVGAEQIYRVFLLEDFKG